MSNRKGDIVSLFDFFNKGINPPKTQAESNFDSMVSAGNNPMPSDTPQSKAGTPCPKCGHAHKPGVACHFRTKSLGPVYIGLSKATQKRDISQPPQGGGNSWYDPATGQFAKNPNKAGSGSGKAGEEKKEKKKDDSWMDRLDLPEDGESKESAPQEEPSGGGGVDELFDYGDISSADEPSPEEPATGAGKLGAAASGKKLKGEEKEGVGDGLGFEDTQPAAQKPGNQLNQFSDRIYEQAYQQHLDAGLPKDKAQERADYAAFDAMLAFHEAQDQGIDPSNLSLDQISELANAQKEKRIKESAQEQQQIREQFGSEPTPVEAEQEPSAGAQQRFLDFMDQMKPPEQRAGGAVAEGSAPEATAAEAQPATAMAEEFPAGALGQGAGAASSQQVAPPAGPQDEGQVQPSQAPAQPSGEMPQGSQPQAQGIPQYSPEGAIEPEDSGEKTVMEEFPAGATAGTPKDTERNLKQLERERSQGAKQEKQEQGAGRAPKKESLGVPFSQWYGAGASVGSGLARPGGAWQPTAAFGAQRAHMLLNPDIPTNRGVTMAHPGTQSRTKEYQDIGQGKTSSGGGSGGEVRQGAHQSGGEVRRSLESLFDGE